MTDHNQTLAEAAGGIEALRRLTYYDGVLREGTVGSTKGPLMSAGAASDQDGRRPRLVSAHRVNWLTTSKGVLVGTYLSLSRIRRVQILAARAAASSAVSLWVTPARTTSPGRSMAPTVSPSTVASARVTR